MGSNKNAREYAKDMLLDAGFSTAQAGALAGRVVKWNAQGLSADVITQIELPKTTEYKTRFYGNVLREKAGLPPLSPAQYIQTESDYARTLRQSGISKSYYNSKKDFTRWIAKDIDPTEVGERAQLGVDWAKSLTPEAKKTLAEDWGMTSSDLAGFALDPKRSISVLKNIQQAVTIGGAALNAGVNINKATAKRYSNEVTAGNLSVSQIAAGERNFYNDRHQLHQLLATAGVNISNLGLQDAELGLNAKNTNTLNKLKSAQRSQFGGSGSGTNVFSNNNSGSAA